MTSRSPWVEEEKEWNIERGGDSGLYYHLISTESQGLTYLGGLGTSSLIGDPLPICKSTLWREMFVEEIGDLSHIPKPTFSRLHDTGNSTLHLGSLHFLLCEMLSPHGELLLMGLGLDDTSFLWSRLSEYPTQNRLPTPIFLVSALYLFPI